MIPFVSIVDEAVESDEAKEAIYIIASREREAAENHSAIVIELLTRAYDQFKVRL